VRVEAVFRSCIQLLRSVLRSALRSVPFDIVNKEKDTERMERDY
jgi:hypothetical protein